MFGRRFVAMVQFLRTLFVVAIAGLGALSVSISDVVAAIDYTANKGVSVSRVRTGEHQGYSRLVLDTTNRVDFKYETSPDGKTIAVDLPFIRWNSKQSHIFKYSKNINRVEFVPSQSGGGTVLIEGKSPIGLRWVRTLAPHGKRGHRLVLDAAASHATHVDEPVIGGWMGAAFGVDWGRAGIPVRSEIEYTKRFEAEGDVTATNQSSGVSQTGTVKVSNSAFMLNTYMDIPYSKKIMPYVGFGLGFSRNTVEADTTVAGSSTSFDSDDTTSFAWSLSAGAGYRMGPDWLIDFGYRYSDFGEIMTQNGTGANANRTFEGTLKVHDVMLGLRYIL
jgi:opacity protein-like surface antigen